MGKIGSTLSGGVSELDNAFIFAKNFELTSATSLSGFKSSTSITRKALAKILSLYMSNYWKADIDAISDCSKFTDTRNETEENQRYIKLACEYKLM